MSTPEALGTNKSGKQALTGENAKVYKRTDENAVLFRYNA